VSDVLENKVSGLARKGAAQSSTRRAAFAVGALARAGQVIAALVTAAIIAGAGNPAMARPQRAPAPQAQSPDPAPPERRSDFGTPWGRMDVAPGGPVDMRPVPPTAGRTRCIGVDNIAGTQLFGDRAIELTMTNGQRYRMFFSRECPALSFYQGFYYRRYKTGKLCAGRDSVGARSGGECPIASIIPVRRFPR
jgi:hypothetical protein